MKTIIAVKQSGKEQTMRLIDADALIEAIAEILDLRTLSTKTIGKAINKMAIIDPQPHWIPCSERLPEEDGLYLVTTSKRQVQVHVFSHNGNSEEYWMRCNKAWMPLPEPYQEGADE